MERLQMQTDEEVRRRVSHATEGGLAPSATAESTRSTAHSNLGSEASDFPQWTRTVPEVYHYANSNEYAQAVRAWLWAYHNWHLNQCFAPLFGHHYALAASRPLVTTATFPVVQQQTVRPEPTAVAATSVTGSRIFTTPTLGRRLAAEFIDFLFCFIIKLLVSYVLVEFEIINMDKYEKLLNGDSDLKTLIDVTQELFPLEVAHKLITSIVEAIYISYGLGMVPPGCTPGKFLMNLKVVSCSTASAASVDGYCVHVIPGDRVSFKSSLLRSTMKNFALGFMFPVCVGMYVFRFGRSLYDITFNTIVVEF